MKKLIQRKRGQIKVRSSVSMGVGPNGGNSSQYQEPREREITIGKYFVFVTFGNREPSTKK